MENNICNEGDQICNKSCLLNGGRRIDFVLVSKVLKSQDDVDKLSKFIENLVKDGIQFETSRGKSDQNFVFIKLHAPLVVLLHQANVHQIVLQCNSRRTLVSYHPFKKNIFQTIVTRTDLLDPMIKRAPQTLAGVHPTVITSAERSHILHKLLIWGKFGEEENARGLRNLINSGVVTSAYPLHDSPVEWSERGFLSDRQLLGKFWGTLLCIHKNQPLNLIRKYYGSEVAFYFAFVDFYILMLIPASIIGVIVFVYNMLTWWKFKTYKVSGICTGTDMMCPYCMDPKYCGFKPLSSFCNYAKLNDLFDNVSSVLFAICMSFWSTIFLELWNRQETQLKYRWNLLNLESSSVARLAFYENTKYRRVSPLTGKIEPYVPTKKKIINYTITVVCCAFMVAAVLLAILAVMLFRHFLVRYIILSDVTFLNSNITVVSLSMGALLSVLFMKICAPLYMRAAMALTRRENPRTIVEFYNSCIMKSYILSFVNSYFPVFYIAFVKGKLFTYPGDPYMYSAAFKEIRADVCHPAGCLIALTIQLLFILVARTWVARFLASAIPFVKSQLKRRKVKIPLSKMELEQFELDFQLRDCDEVFMLKDYMEMAIQYGFVTFFVSALPLAPLLALLSNLFECRMDASKFLKIYKRPIARRLPGIGAWNTVFRVATFIGTITNAFVIAFTSDATDSIVYWSKHGTFKGYVNSTLSEFAVDDYMKDMTPFFEKRGEVEICLYRGQRYSYTSDDKYQLTDAYWENMTYKLAFIVFFEQIIWVLNSMWAAGITDMPANVAEELADEQMKVKELRFEFLSETYANPNKDSVTQFRL